MLICCDSAGGFWLYLKSLDKICVIALERPLQASFLSSSVFPFVANKVRIYNEQSFSDMLNAGRFFGFHTKIEWDVGKEYGRIQTADGKDFVKMCAHRTPQYDVKVFIHGGECWVSRVSVPKNVSVVDKNKVIIPRSGNPGGSIVGKPKLSEGGTCSSNTYVVAVSINKDWTKEETSNIISYIKTKFFRFLVAIKTSTQDMPPKAYEFVPIQDFNECWTDSKLYCKYGLTKKEIEFVERTIPEMV